VLDDLGREAMTAVAERSHIGIISDAPPNARFRDNAAANLRGSKLKLSFRSTAQRLIDEHRPRWFLLDFRSTGKLVGLKMMACRCRKRTGVAHLRFGAR
jgi:hypothetical protein